MLEHSTYNVVETLKVNEKQVFKAMSHHEKMDSMLNPVVFPNCVPTNPMLIKSHVSPSLRLLPPIIATLSSLGSLQLSKYHHDRETNETALKSIAELCEVRKASFSLVTYVKMTKLLEIVKELSFYNFEWCPEIIDSKRLLAAFTQSQEIIFYAINSDNKVSLLHSKKLDKSVNTMKWIVHDDNHFLYVAGAKGHLTRFSIELGRTGGVEKLIEVSDFTGKLKVPISNIEYASDGKNLILVASKSHSVEIICNSDSITKYVGMNITGMTLASSANCTSPAFLITTLDNKVFYLEVTKSEEGLKISKFDSVDILNSSLQPEKFGAYGITTSKNKVLFYVALYPKSATDHLTLKQPLNVSVNLFSRNDPYILLVENKSLRLTDFHDCVEAVRFIGTGKLETMTPLSSMNYDIGLTDEFCYYLKIQLLVTNAKLVFYKTRSETIYEVTQDTKESVRKIIEVIHAYKVLKTFSPKKKHSKLVLLSIRCLINFVADYINEEIVTEPFHIAQEMFKNDLLEVLIPANKCEALKSIKSELCYYCEANIDVDKLVCEANHQPVRCSITKLQLPAVAMNFCARCNCNVMDLLTLKEVTGSDEQLCLYCDGHIAFA